MNDTELSPAEDARLRQLLQRAAEGVEVVTPAALADATVAPSNRRRGPWVLAVAAVLALIAGGAWFATAGDDGVRIDTGPATADDQSFELEGEGIWRLPTRLPEGWELRDVITVPTGFDLQLAVDDPTEPTRWLGMTPTGLDSDVLGGETLLSGELPGGATYRIVSPLGASGTGSVWAQLTGPGNSGYLAVAARGVDPQEIVDFFGQVYAEIGNLTDVTAVNSLLADPPLPVGLVPAWNPEHVGFTMLREARSVGLALYFTTPLQADSPALSMVHTGLAPAVAALQRTLTAELSGTDPGRVRPELGSGIVTTDAPSPEQVVVFTADGTQISAGPTIVSPDASGVTDEQLLDLIRSLRSMSRAELDAELAGRGLEVVDYEALSEATTTTLGDVPGGG